MRKIALFLFTGLVFLQNSFAWDLKQFKEEAASPYTTSAKLPLIAGSLLTIGFVISARQVGNPFQIKQIRNQPLGEAAVWGDIMGQMVPNALYTAGMAIASRYGDTQAHDRAIGMFKATMYSASVTTVLKYTIREPRPNDNSTKNSFPSGHSTTAFAFSGFVAGEHGWGWGSAALLLSTFTGYSRITDDMHRVHDVVAGATIGWAYGWGISRIKRRRDEAFYLVPILDTKTAGLSFYKEF